MLNVILICSQWQGHNISGKDHRVHCSININTETGRLSARRPNLQVLFNLQDLLTVGLHLEFIKCHISQSFMYGSIYTIPLKQEPFELEV